MPPLRAAEPAFAALLGVTLYGINVSQAKWLCLIPVIGGIVIASLTEVAGGGFSFAALVAACIANLFAAFRSNENKKLMDTEGLKERIGCAQSAQRGSWGVAPLWRSRGAGEQRR